MTGTTGITTTGTTTTGITTTGITTTGTTTTGITTTGTTTTGITTTGITTTGATDTTDTADGGWARTWSTSPHAPIEAFGPLPSFADTTLRQVVRVSGGGRQVRLRITNEYGTAPLTIGAARIALAAPEGGIRPGSERVLTFDGKSAVTVPTGAPMLSDPVALSLSALAELSISLYLPEAVKSATCHGMGVQTAWTTPGNSVDALTLPADAESLPLQALISALDVRADAPVTTVAIIGDSNTDCSGTTPDTNRRWTDRLAERLAELDGPAVCVSNQGISGNRMLNEGLGDAALARFDRDVLATPGLRHVVLAIGLGDICISYSPQDGSGPPADFLAMFPGAPVTADDLIAGYRQLIDRARTRGLRVHAPTLTPYEGDDTFTPEGERARQRVNEWIRTSGAFDAVLDFDAVWSDPAHPSRIRDGFHAGDHLHGSDAGCRALGDSIDLALFR
ncbi:SGNH/GDSL hydrolase family protein [Streptomyces corynorhini]|uniref:SGNH/GDSL hydrolase family protein n=1 Tax=Streptomyces corynorhini TaxID=2282652 RepID=A0A370BBW9_9ACTN|nr:SGNH/GDSL hydrolase family protein [Streptomyces corynorhini]RDG37303.1 SGNH/GDSL hydrolase family protein [Streptomyces corynorhini]